MGVLRDASDAGRRGRNGRARRLPFSQIRPPVRARWRWRELDSELLRTSGCLTDDAKVPTSGPVGSRVCLRASSVSFHGWLVLYPSRMSDVLGVAVSSSLPPCGVFVLSGCMRTSGHSIELVLKDDLAGELEAQAREESGAEAEEAWKKDHPRSKGH